VRAFQPLEEYERGVATFLDGIKSIPPASGFSKVLVPGDPERHTEEKQLREGIKLPEKIWNRLVECGEKYHVKASGS
jgi:ureidoglycolate dehydrogenase (NAD+)